MNKKMLILIGVVAVIVFAIIGGIVINEIKRLSDKSSDNPSDFSETTEISIVPTMRDKIITDSSWCGTFQLVWNDMKNEVVKRDIVFTPQEEMADNLNMEEFTQDMISEEYYYKVYGLKTLSLKQQIEKGIKEKFNQESDILDNISWSENELDNQNNQDIQNYLFYVMLYRKFEFLKQFDNLEQGKFADRYDNIEYFGIDGNTDNSVGNQIQVLYYNSKDDFAVILNTKTNDEVIFCKNPQGENFKEIYDNMSNKATTYDGNRIFEEIDEFKAPKLNIDEYREYTELQNKEFETADNNKAQILKAIQTIKFSLDEKGGEIKSEAAIDMRATSMQKEEENQPRYFYVDNTFAIFLREQGQDLPYFAAKVDDITKFQ